MWSSSEPTKPSAPYERPRPLLLLVEDQTLIAMALEEDFEARGFEIAIAQTFKAARAQFRNAQRPFDAVISDLRLPDGNGEDLIEDFRRLQPGLPFVIFSASAHTLQLSEMQSVNLRIVDKPCLADDLAEALRMAGVEMPSPRGS